MVAGVPGRHGQHVQRHVAVGSEVERVSATALSLNMVAINVLDKTTTVTAVTRKNALLVSTQSFTICLCCKCLE